MVDSPSAAPALPTPSAQAASKVAASAVKSRLFMFLLRAVAM
jgi:hypothetical protein